MDHAGVIARGGVPTRGPSSADAWVLPSRTQAVAAGRAALEAAAGLILITGDAGSGKTWFWRHLAAADPTPRRWLGIALAPMTSADDLFRVLGHGLGLPQTGPTTARRLALADFLAERSADGERWVLVIDEAQNLSDAVLEEVRLLANRLGHDDGFAALLLVGQTRLAQRLQRQQALAALAARVAGRIHLGPIDADDALGLLQRRWPERSWARDEVERLHRDSWGNPQRLLGLASVSPTSREPWRSLSPARPLAPSPFAPPSVETPSPRAEASPPPAPLLGSSKPPLRVEEGLIEVGWEDDPAEPAPPAPAAPAPAAPPAPAAAEETIDDHYAALQAWNEWSRHQGRAPAEVSPAPGALDPAPEKEAGVAEDAFRADAWSPAEGRGQVWAEGPDRFAPYSQLFSRLKPSKGSD
jgi:type II secretory pathway predicted ATPase ExeA